MFIATRVADGIKWNESILLSEYQALIIMPFFEHFVARHPHTDKIGDILTSIRQY